MAHKICPRCGVIFEVKDNPVYCSPACKRLFQQSNLDYLKKAASDREKKNKEIELPI